MNIIWQRPDGGVSVTHLITTTDSQTESARLRANGDVPADWILAAFDKPIPTTREWREAWEWRGNSVNINKDKAVELTKERLRREREPLLAALDTEYLRALETGVDTSTIVAEKQRLRDITTIPVASMTLDELTALTATSAMVTIRSPR